MSAHGSVEKRTGQTINHTFAHAPHVFVCDYKQQSAQTKIESRIQVVRAFVFAAAPKSSYGAKIQRVLVNDKC